MRQRQCAYVQQSGVARHHCLHSYPHLLRPQTNFQAHVRTRANVCVPVSVYTYPRVSQALGTAFGGGWVCTL
jgi:hypothetical protein